MSSRLVDLCFDAIEPLAMARFWAVALGWEVDDSTIDPVRLVPTDATPFQIVFRRVEKPKVGQNRIHLDLTTTSVEDQQTTVSRLIEIGGSHVDIGQSPEEDHVVLADPEGNELCILAPFNSFLAGCERLGSINCDGTRALGQFWSEVLGWPLVWDQDEETAIRAADRTGPLVTWSGPPLMPRLGKDRLHLEIAPLDDADQAGEIERLVALGATRATDDSVDGPVIMTDVDGNEFWLSASG